MTVICLIKMSEVGLCCESLSCLFSLALFSIVVFDSEKNNDKLFEELLWQKFVTSADLTSLDYPSWRLINFSTSKKNVIKAAPKGEETWHRSYKHL